MSKTKSTTAKEISSKAGVIGDKLNAKFEKSNLVEDGLAAIKAYNTSLKAQKDILVHNKITNTNQIMDFYK